MTPQNLVCSRELAERMKELGYPQESLFVWWEPNAMSAWQVIEQRAIDGRTLKSKICIAAPTAGELGEVLPRSCPTHGGDLQICHSFSPGWFVGYGNHMDLRGCHVDDGPTLADAMAKIWIYLKENELI